ncbi:MAG: four helix bundle protein [Bacteroidetes bacterium]|nr:four helix bundle protein [Bacteroidota bacterium]
MHNFRELKIWQKSREIIKKVYAITVKSSGKEKYVLDSQINRSVISSNIAEGPDRNRNNDFQRLFDIAIGSAFELESQLIIANDLGCLTNDFLSFITLEIKEIQKIIRRFRHHIEKESNVYYLSSKIKNYA